MTSYSVRRDVTTTAPVRTIDGRTTLAPNTGLGDLLRPEFGRRSHSDARGLFDERALFAGDHLFDAALGDDIEDSLGQLAVENDRRRVGFGLGDRVERLRYGCLRERLEGGVEQPYPVGARDGSNVAAKRLGFFGVFGVFRLLGFPGRLNSDCFQVFLGRFAEAFPRSHNVMILDNGQFHKAKKLSIPTGVQLKFLPPYSPELNPVERLWQDLKDTLGFDFYKCLADLRQDARTALSRYTDEAVASLTGYDYLLEAASVGLL